MEPWNDPAILAPPISTTLCLLKNGPQDLSHACNNAIKVLLNQSPLYKESAILSRFIYKFDKKFRNDIGYRILKKINTALRRYLTLNLLKDIQNFVAVIPTNIEENYLPTRQMLQYVMVRIMSFSKIMMRICINSKQASIFYMNRIKRGESHWMSLMPYALLCRIWTMSSVLLQHSCIWYATLYPFVDQLQPKGLEFFCGGYKLPENLNIWLDLKNLDNHGKFLWTGKKSEQFNLDFAEDEEINFDSILDYVKDINSEENDKLEVVAPIKPQDESVQVPTLQLNNDQGVSISREYFQSFFNKQISETDNVQKNHTADNVTSKVTLDKFISKEEEYRNGNSHLSLTKGLSFMQWQSLRSGLVSLSETLSKNRKIELKFKKIWKEKCLDYL